MKNELQFDDVHRPRPQVAAVQVVCRKAARRLPHFPQGKVALVLLVRSMRVVLEQADQRECPLAVGMPQLAEPNQEHRGG